MSIENIGSGRTVRLGILRWLQQRLLVRLGGVALLVLLLTRVGVADTAPVSVPGNVGARTENPKIRDEWSDSAGSSAESLASVQVLESTVQIWVIPGEFRDADTPRSSPAGASGVVNLGSLVLQNGSPKLYTHNHYDANPEYPLTQAGQVIFTNARNELLTTLSGSEFRELLASAQDPGNALIDVPAALRPEALATLTNITLVPKYAELGAPDQLSAGAVVWVPHHYPGGVEVLKAAVDAIVTDGNGLVSTYRLHTTTDVAIAGGDSGGEIWFRGKVVGNTWAALVSQSGQMSNRFCAASFLTHPGSPQ
jgi:hypothetical protein